MPVCAALLLLASAQAGPLARVGLEAGALVGGSGEIIQDHDLLGGSIRFSSNYDEESGLSLSGHAYAGLGGPWSLGSRLAWVRQVEVDLSGWGDVELGEELHLLAEMEYRTLLRPRLETFVTAHIGPYLLLAGEDFIERGNSLGLNFGLGGGLAAPVTEVLTFALGLRVEDLRVRTVQEEEILFFGASSAITEQLAGYRVRALASAEYRFP